MKVLSVSEFNTQIKTILETHFQVVEVKGEVSKPTYHSSGHLYFSLKDDESVINCVMWRSRVRNFKKIKDGDLIIVRGRVSLYIPRGDYKIDVSSYEFVGDGDLQKKLEELRKELYNLGYFSNKKPLPLFPKRVALITAKTGAAIKDMQRVANNRWRLTKFYIFNTLVQGESASKDIAFNIKRANEYKFEDGSKFDIIVLARGGGSKEDLWAFNTREVAEAIFHSSIPVVSAIGHEIDYLLSDDVADKRAATPSNAMEIILPDEKDILRYIDELWIRFSDLIKHIIKKKKQELDYLKRFFELKSPKTILNNKNFEVFNLKESFNYVIEKQINNKINYLNSLKSLYITYNPLFKIKKVKNEIENIKHTLFTEYQNIIYSKEQEIKHLKENLKREFEKVLIDKKNSLYFLSSQFNAYNPSKIDRIEISRNGKKISFDDIKEGEEFEISNFNVKILAKALKKEKNVL